MKLAIVFPGQASQFVGMGRGLFERFPQSASVFEEADSALGEDFRKVIFDGPDEAINLTANTQPAVLTVSVAAWQALKKAKPDLAPAFLAGHSLGEYSAHVAAGTLSFRDAVTTVRKRGQFMQAAVPVGVGAMAALMGIEAEPLAQVCAEAARGQVVSPANDNAPGQIVIAGHTEAVQRACELAKARGCKRAVMLPVSAPFHCALMAPARENLSPVLDALAFDDPRWPVVANASARPVTSGADAREKLREQVDAPVRWRETLLFFQEQGVDTLVEVGPGTVLGGLAKRVLRDCRILNVQDSASMEACLAALGT
jgi:[acyl-carrier-protein] S-malonyltransferase